ncbi:putative ABC transport system permease protein [Psychrobacillus psychrotolerans]|uniref:Putative ABC transport system permease protein n=1 Tax=Psychrobacillus psychrotolerans TaxID=126156 RepID=A0A1I5VUS9_9BACI|nr:ABC transporter permease [Psychrobacillus psychrotolerans]SFQ11324.1 putative ABC transport system permease protein [Psychrobacillus psychrotolerans]
MNIVNKLTVRQLKENKRRTLVTIIGVIISVMMVTMVPTFVVSVMDLMLRQTITTTGEWHVLYKDVNPSQLKAIDADEDTHTIGVSRDRGYALIEEGDNANKPYLHIREYNEQGFKQFPIELSSGQLPQADNEIVISEEIATNAKVVYKIGDTITLDIGERIRTGARDAPALKQEDPLVTDKGERAETIEHTEAKSYKVVGIIKRPTWESAEAPGYSIFSYVDEGTLGANDIVNAAVVLNKVKSSLFTHAEDLANQNNIGSESIDFNYSLLKRYGLAISDKLNRTILSLSLVITGIIIVGSVSLIYNAFAISVSERSRHLGMLSSVGATARQKRNSVFFEGMVIGLISIPIGIILGVVVIGITFLFINPMIRQGIFGITEELAITITPGSILIACAVSILTIFLSTYLPARKASRISAIDAIRQTNDVKLTNKTVKTSKLVSKIFGMEADIGLKNLKRNKRRYQATVFSLVISIVLFLSMSYFTDNIQKTIELPPDKNYDIQVSKFGMENLDDRVINSIANLDDITEWNVTKNFGLFSWVDEDVIANEYHDLAKDDPSLLKEGKYRYFISFHVLDDKNLQNYAKSVGADYKQLIDAENLSAIVVDKLSYNNAAANKIVAKKAIHAKVDQSLDIVDIDWETGKETPVNKIKIAALTGQLPMGVEQAEASYGNLNMIISEQVMDQLESRENVQLWLNLKSTDPMATQQEIEEMKESNLIINNGLKDRQENEQLILLISVLGYGFILLITLVSIANIFNTISTSISLRKREFAMLKSVGMTPKGFNKMINYESIFYGIKSLLYGLPISIGVIYLIYKALMTSFQFEFTLPWISIIYVIMAVFIMVSTTMLYASSKVKKENIIDALKQESI